MFKFEENENVLKIQVSTKRFDATNTEKFKACLEEYSTQPIKYAQVDLASVEFIDSSGVGALLSIHRRLAPNSPPVTLVNPQAAVISILELLRLTQVFDLQLNKSSK